MQITEGYLVFDDTLWIRISRSRWIWFGDNGVGMAHGVIKGSGWYLCVCQPCTGPILIIDYRIYDPEGDGKSKLDHVH